MINGLVFVACFLIWIFESIAQVLSLNFQIPSVVLHITLLQQTGTKVFAVFVLILGLLIYALSLYSLSDSWRIGIDREKPGKLVTTGIFAWSRNPIYISLDLLVLGTFLLQGDLIFLILSVCIAISLHIQILQEEKFLVQMYKEEFLKYCLITGRYLKLYSSLR
jgi:protein-S-isoprenylcysteine O-methyltransferase Ste14